MKRILSALLLASLALPVVAAESHLPFEQTQLDRALPNVKDPVVTDSASSEATLFGLHEDPPYEITVASMKLPDVKDPVVLQPIQVAGPATGMAATEATGPWAHDPNFIAPPQ